MIEPDRGKPGSKRHIAVDVRGTPLGVLTGRALQHDSRMLAPVLDAIPPGRSGRRGRLRQRPDKLHADKGYDYRRYRRECRTRGIQPRIAHSGMESSQRLSLNRFEGDQMKMPGHRYRRKVEVDSPSLVPGALARDNPVYHAPLQAISFWPCSRGWMRCTLSGSQSPSHTTAG